MSQEFKQRIGVEAISLSMFEDVNETWAKRPEQVVRVRVEFADGVTTFLTPQEYNALPAAQRELICKAPSSPRPTVTP